MSHVHSSDMGDNDLSLEDLNAIMNLQRQEAFDETLEEVHASISRRDVIRKSFTLNSSPNGNNNKTGGSFSSRPPPSPCRNSGGSQGSQNQDTAESQLLKIIQSQASIAAQNSPSPSRQSAASNGGGRSGFRSRRHRRQNSASSTRSMYDYDDGNDERTVQTMQTTQTSQSGRNHHQSQRHHHRRRSRSSRTRGIRRSQSNEESESPQRKSPSSSSSSRSRASTNGLLETGREGNQRRSSSNGQNLMYRNKRNASMPSLENSLDIGSKLDEIKNKNDSQQQQEPQQQQQQHNRRRRSTSRSRLSRTIRPSRRRDGELGSSNHSSRMVEDEDSVPSSKTMQDGRKRGNRGADGNESAPQSSMKSSQNRRAAGTAAATASGNTSVRSMRSTGSSGSRNPSASPLLSYHKGHGRRSSRNDTDLVNLKATLGRLELSAAGVAPAAVASPSSSSSRRNTMKKQLSAPDLSSQSNSQQMDIDRTRRPSSNDLRFRSTDLTRKRDGQEGVRSSKSNDSGDHNYYFEKLWHNDSAGHKSEPTLNLDSAPSTPTSDVPSKRSVCRSSSKKDLLSVDSSSPGMEKLKKTKLEKIHELQAKCDRYKREWVDASNEKKRYRKDLEASRQEVAAKTQEVETFMAETKILQKNLSEALSKLDETQEEQRKERTELSNTAKDLAQARIDHAKSVNEARELREKLDKLEEQMNEKDLQISSLKNELQASKENCEHLEADVLYADDQIVKLEEEIKKIEDEVSMYREAAETDGEENGGENLRCVRNEMEVRLHEEREKRLDEKQRKLDEKLKHFEDEKDRYLEFQRERERDFMDQQAHEIKKSKSRDEARHQRDDEINERLKALEDDNTALQGRLKSEQLDANVKLKAKEDAIEKLQKELAQTKNELKQQEADPNSLLSLQKEAETSKTEAETTMLDLEEALKQNAMLQEGINDAVNVNKEMKVWVKTLEDTVNEQKREAEIQKRRAEEWQRKSGEWSDKAHQWKEKAEHWEKTAKSLDPDANTDMSSAETAMADPQALFLAAAVEKKKIISAATNGNGSSRWDLGGMFKKGGMDVPRSREDAQQRIEELEIENTKQAVELKNLKSEMVHMQSSYREKAYEKQQELGQLQKTIDAVELKCANLAKELDLARKLNQMVGKE